MRNRVRFGRSHLVGLGIVLATISAMVWTAIGHRPELAEHPRVFAGSLVLEDYRPLTVVDLASATVTVRLQGVDALVGARSYSEVQAVPMTGGTMLVNRVSGAFNLLKPDDYALDPQGSGVGIARLEGSTASVALAAGSSVFVVRQAPRSSVSLVDASTVRAAARRGDGGGIRPLGYASLAGSVSVRSGATAVEGTSLFVLVSTRAGCSVQQLTPGDGDVDGLLATDRLSSPRSCATSSLEGGSDQVALASPGRITILDGTASDPAHRAIVARPRVVPFPSTRADTQFIPVSGASSQSWFLARSDTGWSLVGVSGSGRPLGPYPLAEFGPSSTPAVPAISGRLLYTLDRSAQGQPNLWVIDTTTGRSAPLAGASTYPQRSPQEVASFAAATVVADGPRIVFNNPESLEAVVVFTDATRSPALIDKSDGAFVSAAGPADLVSPPRQQPAHSIRAAGATPPPPPPPPAERVLPVVQPVDPGRACASTDEKPSAPVVTRVSPTSGAALVDWSYELLDQTDCEPDTWTVAVTAERGPQPSHPVQSVGGQTEYLFTGLRPATRYKVVVTAYLNGRFTRSKSASFTTEARGADPPVAVSTTSDGLGDWVVSWSPCHPGDDACVVPATTWTIRAAACGVSFVSVPPTVLVPGSSTSVTISAQQLGLLGASLTFTVTGSSATGLAGAPTSDGQCTASWRAPDPSSISLSAAATPKPGGTTLDVRLVVSSNGPAVEGFGSAATEFVYTVGGRTVGPTSFTSVTVADLPAGPTYSPSVRVYPSGHPGAAVTVHGASFTATVPWPGDLAVSVTPRIGVDPNRGSVDLTFPGAPSGELEAQDGTIRCGGADGAAVPVSGVTTTGVLSVGPIDLSAIGGDCELTGLTLTYLGSPDPFGVASPALSASFELGTQPVYGFVASWVSTCGDDSTCPMRVDVGYDGASPPPAGDAWVISASGPTGTGDPCRASSGPTELPPFSDPGSSPPYSVALVLPDACFDAPSIDVTVSYRYLGVTRTIDLGAPVGTPPQTTTTTTTVPPTTTTTSPPPETTTTPPDPSTTTRTPPVDPPSP